MEFPSSFYGTRRGEVVKCEEGMVGREGMDVGVDPAWITVVELGLVSIGNDPCKVK